MGFNARRKKNTILYSAICVVWQTSSNLSNDPAHFGFTIKVLEHEYDVSRLVRKVRQIFCNTLHNAEPFYYQLIHIMLKNTELLKHSKIMLQHVSVYIETIFRELKSVLGF